jgi:hypothetical protein
VIELHFDDGAGNVDGRPGPLVPQGDQFVVVPTTEDNSTYTFTSSVPTGIGLHSQGFYWLVLHGLNAQPVWHAYDATYPDTGVEIAVDKLYFMVNEHEELLNGGSLMVSLNGCCDSPSPSPSPLGCGVRALGTTANLAPSIYLALYPQLQRFHTNRTGCLITSFTLTLLRTPART